MAPHQTVGLWNQPSVKSLQPDIFLLAPMPIHHNTLAPDRRRSGILVVETSKCTRQRHFFILFFTRSTPCREGERENESYVLTVKRRSMVPEEHQEPVGFTVTEGEVHALYCSSPFTPTSLLAEWFNGLLWKDRYTHAQSVRVYKSLLPHICVIIIKKNVL